MKKGYRKCTTCKNEFPGEEIKVINGAAYCETCAKDREKEIEDNKKIKDYLYYHLCNEEVDLLLFLLKQVKNMKNDFGFTSEGILNTLHYIFDISESPPVFVPRYGIEGLVVSNYYFARKYYDQVKELNKAPKEEIDEILKMPTREIHIKSSSLASQKKAYLNRQKDLKYGPIIDLDFLEDEEKSDAEI